MDDPDNASEEALPAAEPPEPPTGRGSLDRRRILDAAVSLIDQQGLGHLTMRRLGSHLGVEGMALYHYIPGRESLLDGVVETVIDELDDDPDLTLIGHDWVGYLRQLARGIRRIALAHPEVFPLIATRPASSPWTRPPLRSLRWTETFLQILRDCGVPDGAAIAAYRDFSSFLVGRLLIEVSSGDIEAGSADQHPSAQPVVPDVAEYPLLAGLKPDLLRESPADFEDALEWLLQRLAAKAAG